VKLTYRQIEFLTSSEVVQKVLDKATGKFGLHLYRVMSKVQQEAEPFRKQFKKIVDEYGKKDENGNIKINTIGNQQSISVIAGKEIEASVKMEELRNEEVEINAEPVVFNVDDNSNISASELLALSIILKEES